MLDRPLGTTVPALALCFTFAVGCAGCLQPALAERTRGLEDIILRFSNLRPLQVADSLKLLEKNLWELGF